MSTHLVNSNAVLLKSCTKRNRWYHSACLPVWVRSDMDGTSSKAMLLLDDIDSVSEMAIAIHSVLNDGDGG